MYVVYWTEGKGELAGPRSQGFATGDMKQALNFMEALRMRQRQGDPVSFITMCSEHPDSVGLPGVAETGSDYKWKKRRL
ncbi:hypothetical protein [Lacisediminimonas profundi]|uniref:hypothetical protein n=1 Tax=Lacisediminimonas profundi TaxID=2603856 RepID=UPI00124B3372|nr:hypothetical protein [Lacisediminimonas profundi]